MAFKCFKCSEVFDLIKPFMKHLIKRHGLNKDSEFVCMHRNCNRSYPSSSSFRKHLTDKHLIPTVETVNPNQNLENEQMSDSEER